MDELTNVVETTIEGSTGDNGYLKAGIIYFVSGIALGLIVGKIRKKSKAKAAEIKNVEVAFDQDIIDAVNVEEEVTEE